MTANTPLRAQPRLWVETVWLLRSLQDATLLRDPIQLKLGVNLVVSPPAQGSSGHGVGKTAFCQLLRFVLDDSEAWEGTELHEELRHSISDGAVAARVHVGGETWTVLKPWTHQKQYRASREASWAELARSADAGGYAAYQQALQKHLVECLPVRDLPGTGQRIEWRHILAWCSRDQNARYKHYYAWREGGVGLSQPGKSPALVMRVVLGLLRDTQTLREFEAKTREADDAKTLLDRLKQQQHDLLEHARLQLTRVLEAPVETRFRKTDLMDLTSLVGLAEQKKDRSQQELADATTQLDALETERDELLTRRAPTAETIKRLSNDIGQLEAFIAGNEEGLKKLRQEAESLQQRGQVFCESGYRILAECSYVQERIGKLQFERAQTAAERKSTVEEYEKQLARLRPLLDGFRSKCKPLDEQLDSLKGRARQQSQQQQALLRDMQRLTDALDAHAHYERVVAGEETPAEIAAADQRSTALLARLSQLELEQLKLQEAAKERRKAIDALTHRLATELPQFTFGTFDEGDEKHPRPFRIGPLRSTAFKVLATLLGDLVCLLDSSSAESFHPGFLLHDSPREAEMSAELFWALIAAVRKHSGEDVQYIVTTSTEAREDFRPLVRLELSSGDDKQLLFGQKVGTEQRELGQ